MIEEKDLKERVDALVTVKFRPFTITSAPPKVFEEFSQFCKDEAHDIWWRGIEILLENWKGNSLVFEKLEEQEARIIQLEEKLKEKEKPKVKTFGGGK